MIWCVRELTTRVCLYLDFTMIQPHACGCIRNPGFWIHSYSHTSDDSPKASLYCTVGVRFDGLSLSSLYSMKAPQPAVQRTSMSAGFRDTQTALRHCATDCTGPLQKKIQTWLCVSHVTVKTIDCWQLDMSLLLQNFSFSVCATNSTN